MAKVGFGFTGSFCTLNKVLPQAQLLKSKGHEVIPIVTPKVIMWDTRFGKAEEFRKTIEHITGERIISTIKEAEKFGPKEPLDALIIAPATGDFISKLSNAHTDDPVLMATKATLRNESPIIIGMATNDGLGLNFPNIAELVKTKNIFFIPFGQDNYEKKPNSLVSHFNLTEQTLEAALKKEQLQPILQEHKIIKKV